MDNYHIFSEDFDEILEPDSDGIPHLYVPHAIFIKEGVVVYDYQGAIPEMGDNPEMELNEEQKEAIREIYRTGFNLLK